MLASLFAKKALVEFFIEKKHAFEFCIDKSYNFAALKMKLN